MTNAERNAARRATARMVRIVRGGPVVLDHEPTVEPVIRLGDHITDGCCELARERLGCVCRRSWSCEVHGVRCIGSHD